MEDPDSPQNSPTPVAMMVFDATGMPYSKAKANMCCKGPRGVLWPPGHLEAPDAQASQASQPSEKGKGTGKPSQCPLGGLFRKRARKHMFKTTLVERRLRAIIMRENVARKRSFMPTLN